MYAYGQCHPHDQDTKHTHHCLKFPHVHLWGFAFIFISLIRTEYEMYLLNIQYTTPYY